MVRKSRMLRAAGFPLGAQRRPLELKRVMILTTLHVIVDRTVDLKDSFWAVAGAVAGLLAAAGTVFLAIVTWRLADSTAKLAKQSTKQVEETADAMAQAERHHQQTMMPLVSASANGVKAQSRETDRVAMALVGKLRNIGPGPSVGVNILWKPSGYSSRWFYAGIVSANSEIDLECAFEFDPHMVPAAIAFPYDCLIRFQSVFGTEGFVHLQSYSGDAKDAIIMECVTASTPRDEMKNALQRVLNDYFAGPPIGQPQLPADLRT
jgi:hypothetical protein